jgi:hypothetical protein
MRVRASVAALVLLAPLAARAAEEPEMPEIARGPGSPAECARLNKQIHFYEDMTDRAKTLGDAMWVDRMQQQVDFLKQHQEERCPRDADNASAKAAFLAFMKMLKVAGQAALTFFTFGAY